MATHALPNEVIGDIVYKAFASVVDALAERDPRTHSALVKNGSASASMTFLLQKAWSKMYTIVQERFGLFVNRIDLLSLMEPESADHWPMILAAMMKFFAEACACIDLEEFITVIRENRHRDPAKRRAVLRACAGQWAPRVHERLIMLRDSPVDEEQGTLAELVLRTLQGPFRASKFVPEPAEVKANASAAAAAAGAAASDPMDDHDNNLPDAAPSSPLPAPNTPGIAAAEKNVQGFAGDMQAVLNALDDDAAASAVAPAAVVPVTAPVAPEPLPPVVAAEQPAAMAVGERMAHTPVIGALPQPDFESQSETLDVPTFSLDAPSSSVIPPVDQQDEKKEEEKAPTTTAKRPARGKHGPAPAEQQRMIASIDVVMAPIGAAAVPEPKRNHKKRKATAPPLLDEPEGVKTRAASQRRRRPTTRFQGGAETALKKRKTGK